MSLELLSHPFARPILLTVLLVLVVFWYAYRRVRPYRVLCKALAANGHLGKPIPVGYVSQEDLAGGRVQARCAKPAVLTTNAEGDVDVYVLTRWHTCLRYQMPSADTDFEWFRSMLGGLLPPLLRLRFDGRSHYLFKRNPMLGGPARTATKFHSQLAAVIPALPPPSPDRFKYLEWAVRLYALVLIGTVLVAVGASWAPDTDEEPMVLARQHGGPVHAASHRWLYRFDGADKLVERIDLEALGISDGVSDLESLDDGRFLIGDSGAGIIKVCDFTARQCAPLPGFDTGGLFLRAFQFARNPRRARIYAADSARHRLLELDAEGVLLREITGAGALCFPNDPLLVENLLVVANTNHHALVAWDLSSRDLSAPTREWPMVGQGRDDVRCPPIFDAPDTEFFAREKLRPDGSRAVAFANARPGKVWPIAIAEGANGGLWVLNAGANLQHADLLLFDQWPEDSPPRRVVLNDQVDPIGMLVREQDLLVAETDGPSIIRISHDGRLLGDFGDTRFTDLMASIADRQRMYERVALYGRYAVGVLILVLVMTVPLIVSLRIKHIQAQDPSFGPLPGRCPR